jgi:plastocyanin
VYEQDFPRVQVGSQVTITTTAYPGRVRTGRVTYIDPQLNVESRTARVRVEVPNAGRELRLGMYAELQVARPGVAGAVTVPRDAVQTIGNRHFVYLSTPGERARFVEREVRLGERQGDTVQIASGVSSKDTVVTKGSFFVRAERERLGLRAAPGDASSRAPGAMAGMTRGERDHTTQGPRVTITERGFQPDRVTVAAGEPVRVTFVRTTDDTCAKEVTIPSLQIKRALPLNEPVVIELPGKQGEIAFVCGMNMLRGTVVVQ